MSSNGAGGVSAEYVNERVARLREELLYKIQELEREMINLAERVVTAIERQTSALESDLNQQTKHLSSDIGKQTAALVAQALAQIKILHDSHEELVSTKTKISLQTEAELQIEIVKKIGAYASTKAKLAAFAQDIESRFRKSYESVYINRQLYNSHFQAIFDEYSKKIKAIASHIYEIVEEDIAPAIEAATRPQSEIFELPIEVDLLRLKTRADSLEKTLELLRASRLDDILSAVDRLKQKVHQHHRLEGLGKHVERKYAVEGLLLTANGSETLLVEATLLAPQTRGAGIVQLTPPEDDFAIYWSDSVIRAAAKAASERPSRHASTEESQRLLQSAIELQAEGTISQESLDLISQFLELRLLTVTE
jgi:hypothetical protein